MALSSTQIGTIGENLLVNAIMKASAGALSPFQPYADDDGIDVLFFHKPTGGAVAVQLKSRTVTLYRAGSSERGNLVHFQVRQATCNLMRSTVLVTALLDSDLTRLEAIWLYPIEVVPAIARHTKTDFVIRANKAPASQDKFSKFRCQSVEDLAQRLIRLCSVQVGVPVD